MLQHAVRVVQFLAYGYTNFGARGYNAHARHFKPNALDVDLQGAHVVVTGATSGLGRVTAHALAERHATVHLVCRDTTRGEAVRDSILSATVDATVHVHRCDLSSLADVSDLAAHLTSEDVPIRVLVNNAGMMTHEWCDSKDGLESAFATNTLGTFALTELLRPLLRRADGGARVVNVSSGGMLTEQLHVDDLQGRDLCKADGSMDGAAQYARCKRRQVAMTEFWARRYADDGIFWASMHPGWAGTPGLEKSMPDFYNATKNQLRSEDQGADTIVYLAIANDVLSFRSGDFFFDRKPAVKHLWLGGTQYANAEVDRMMVRLGEIVTEKGFSLPK